MADNKAQEPLPPEWFLRAISNLLKQIPTETRVREIIREELAIWEKQQLQRISIGNRSLETK